MDKHPITQNTAPLSKEAHRRQFEAERRQFTERAAETLGKLEGILLAGLADGEDTEITAALRIAGTSLIEMMPSLWRYSR